MDAIIIKEIIHEFESMKDRFEYNRTLFDIYEGNLLQYLEQEIKKTVSEKTFNSIKHRIAPVNFLKMIIGKLSKIYSEAPKRTLAYDTSSDKDSFSRILESGNVDFIMGSANEIYNLEKYVSIEPYTYRGEVKFRTALPDSFFVLCKDTSDKKRVTHYIKIMGKQLTKNNRQAYILYVYTDEEFLAINSEGEILSDKMAMLGNSGVNEFGAIPAVVVSKSKFEVIPRIDTDIMKMTKIIPILLTDLNEVIFWQSFGIVYGIDISQDNLQYAPNAFWDIKTDPNNPDAKPSLGTIKPDTDIAEVKEFIKFQLETWLYSRNIKSGSSGEISASGFSKLMDSLDTSEDRQEQAVVFSMAEKELFKLTMRNMIPYWVNTSQLDSSYLFDPNQSVTTKFKKQVPENYKEGKIDVVTKEIDYGLTTKNKAIQDMNPEMTPEEVTALEEKINLERTVIE